MSFKSPAVLVALAGLLLFGSDARATPIHYGAHPVWTHALWFANVAEVGYGDLVFDGGTALFEKGTTEWTLASDLVSKAAPDSVLYKLDLTFSLLVSASDPAPAGSPKEVIDGADPTDWEYAQSVIGSLRDPSDDSLLFQLERFGPAAQIGFGASSYDLGYGLASWLAVRDAEGNLLENHGDINIQLEHMPEPGVGVLLGLGLGALAALHRRARA